MVCFYSETSIGLRYYSALGIVDCRDFFSYYLSRGEVTRSYLPKGYLKTSKSWKESTKIPNWSCFLYLQGVVDGSLL